MIVGGSRISLDGLWWIDDDDDDDDDDHLW